MLILITFRNSDGGRTTFKMLRIRRLNDDTSIRTGKYGAYVYYCTKDMKKPDFISLKKFSGGFMTCEPNVLLEWIETQKKDSGV